MARDSGGRFVKGSGGGGAAGSSSSGSSGRGGFKWGRIGVKLTGAWKKAKKICNNMAKSSEQILDECTREEAYFFKGLLVKGITAGAPGGKAFKELSPTTLAIRKLRGFEGTKPLMNRADLRNSITVKKIGNAYFVGVLANAKGKGGARIAAIANIQEYGSKPIVIAITWKMHRFLMLAFRRAGIATGGGTGGGGKGTGIIVVQIPPRPIFGPVFEKYAWDMDAIKARFAARIRKRGLFG